MNFRLATSIYRKPWLIDTQSALAYLQILEEGKASDLRSSWQDDEEGEPKTIFQKLFAGFEGIVTAPIHRADTFEHPGYEGKTIGILPVIGPMMKEDFCGWFGTAALKNELSLMNASSTMKAIVMLTDTPGGTVDGTETLATAYKASSKEKITVVDGMMCSAGYWAGSGGDQIILTSRTDIVGSIGTMIAFYDTTERMKQAGITLREYYATASKDKNRDFREAKKGEGTMLIETMLDPINDVFLSSVRVNRGDKLDEKQTLTGKTFIGKEAVDVGLADGIDTIENVLSNLVQKHHKDSTLKFSI